MVLGFCALVLQAREAGGSRATAQPSLTTPGAALGLRPRRAPSSAQVVVHGNVSAPVSKVGKDGLIIHAFEWSHRHFPNLMDCRPIYVRRALEAAGFVIEGSLTESMWVPVEIVGGGKPR